jgi:hypothetical protein
MSLLDTASLIVTPNGYKEGKLYSVVPSNGNGDFTVTRATTATRVNSEGLIELVPYNLLTYSQAFDNAAWTKFNVTASTNSLIAPDGTLTAENISVSSTTNDLRQDVSVSQNTQYTFSFYAKKDTISAPQYRVLNMTAVTDIIPRTSYGSVLILNEWVRVTLTFTTPSGCSLVRVQLLSNTNTSGDIGFWGAQLVEGTEAKDYQRTETRLNIPRLDYSLGSCPNLLLEPQRTNLALRSEEFDNASWTKANVSISANTTTAPNGTLTADSIIENSALSTHVILQSVTLSATTYTYSVYVKSISGSSRNVGILLNSALKGVLINPSNGSVVAYTGTTSAADITITSFANGWFRVSVTATTAAITESIRIYLGSGTTWTGPYQGDGTSGAYIWGAQLEAGAYPTSYIPTTSASVTRNADVISLSNVYTNNLITASGGTWFVELKGNVAYKGDASGDGIFLQTVGNTDNFRLHSDTVSTRIIIFKRVSNVNTQLYTTTTNTTKIAIKWNGTTADIFANGVKVVSATAFTTTIMQNLATSITGAPKYINSMALFPTPLTDTQCIELTTL